MMESKKQLREILNNGEAVVLPTETVYGLFAKALDEKAVDYVYELKNRPRDKAMNLNVASYEDILFYSKEQPKYLKQLYDAFLPGPLTIILKANDQVPSGRHFDDIRAQFDFQVTGYQDDNALLGVDSTILDLSVSPARILRQGKITKDDLLAALPELTME